jgi:hypothetical protein
VARQAGVALGHVDGGAEARAGGFGETEVVDVRVRQDDRHQLARRPPERPERRLELGERRPRSRVDRGQAGAVLDQVPVHERRAQASDTVRHLRSAGGTIRAHRHAPF